MAQSRRHPPMKAAAPARHRQMTSSGKRVNKPTAVYSAATGGRPYVPEAKKLLRGTLQPFQRRNGKKNSSKRKEIPETGKAFHARLRGDRLELRRRRRWPDDRRGQVDDPGLPAIPAVLTRAQTDPDCPYIFAANEVTKVCRFIETAATCTRPVVDRDDHARALADFHPGALLRLPVPRHRAPADDQSCSSAVGRKCAKSTLVAAAALVSPARRAGARAARWCSPPVPASKRGSCSTSCGRW